LEPSLKNSPKAPERVLQAAGYPKALESQQTETSHGSLSSKAVWCREENVKTKTIEGEAAMTKTDVQKYKEILETKQAELAEVLRNRDAITIEKSPDALDEVQNAAERELAIRNLDRESNLLRNVRAALRRIEDGTFGVCVHCEEDISPKRINAVPWTPYCIACEEAADRAAVEGGDEALEELLVNAA